jgi:hypothetical protein
MINIKITMVDGSEYKIRNMIADNVKDFHKAVIAPYGTNQSFVEIIPGELIFVANIISIREMSAEDIAKLNEPEEVVGLRETDAEVEEAEESQQPKSE